LHASVKNARGEKKVKEHDERFLFDITMEKLDPLKKEIVQIILLRTMIGLCELLNRGEQLAIRHTLQICALQIFS